MGALRLEVRAALIRRTCARPGAWRLKDRVEISGGRGISADRAADEASIRRAMSSALNGRAQGR